MQIEKDTVVTFHYELRESGGPVLESTQGRSPVQYLHGHGGIVRGLERAMRGRAPGDSFSITVAPEDAYGMRDEEAVRRIPIKHLIKPGKLGVGRAVLVNSRQGRLQGIVRKVGKFNVDLDFNHPMAGRTLDFRVTVVEVRAATAEEVAHRHVHT